jgi:hypothetical protein
MSQMTPYCFKCGAELDPETIYCPVCGRLQRSMVVRAREPGPQRAPQAPPPGPAHEGPVSFYPDREPSAAGEPEPPEPPAPGPPDQPDPYAAPAPDEPVPTAEGVDHIYAQRTYAEEETGHPGAEQPYEQPGYEQRGYEQPGYEQPGYEQPAYEQPGHEQPASDAQAYARRDYGPPGYDDHGHDDHRYGGPTAGAQGGYDASGIPGGRQDYGAGYGAPAPPAAAPAAPRSPQGTVRLAAIVVAGALGLFLVGFGITHVLVGGSGSGSPAGSAAPHRGQAANSGATTTPVATPAPSPSASADTGGGGSNWQRVTSDVSGRCSTTQGCPVTATLKNTGARGAGTVTITLTDGGGNPIATYSGPVPVTDSGQTVQVSGYANGDQLGAYLRGGGTVYLKSVEVKPG